jgi:tetratricopeptide (TPR) repeat protein
VVAVLTLHLASLQSAREQHEAAIRTLNTLIRKYPKGDFVPRALYMSARESEFIGTLDSLRRAVQLYTQCAERNEEMATKATIRLAAVQLRLGNHEEMEHVLTRLWRNKPDMRPEDKAMINATLANNKALLGTDEGRREAVQIASQTLEDTKLPRWWRFRALLHHASLCERAGLFDQALRDYEEVLAMQPATGKAPGKAEWHILYSAGSGAVMQLFYLKRYADAADMADRIAAWNKAEAEPAKHKQFADWAAFIRQTNFVSESAMPF